MKALIKKAPQKSIIKETEKKLASIDTSSLLRKISNFRSLDIKDLTDRQLINEINNVLLFDGSFSYLTNTINYDPGQPYFRVRRVSNIDSVPKTFSNVKDLWEPPCEYIKNYGRLNKPYESLLYVAESPPTAMAEVKINDRDYFIISKFLSTDILKANMIGGNYNYYDRGITNPKAITNHELYTKFLREEFSRIVDTGTEYNYRISEIIAKLYFDLPPRDVQHAWMYSSIKDQSQFNLCFRPEIAHEILSLQGALLCQKRNDKVLIMKILNTDELGNIHIQPTQASILKSKFSEFILD